MFRLVTIVASGGTVSPGTAHVSVTMPFSSTTGPPSSAIGSKPPGPTRPNRVTDTALDPPLVGRA